MPLIMPDYLIQHARFRAEQLSSEGISIELLLVYPAFKYGWINQESMKTISPSFKFSKLLDVVMNQ